VLRKTRWYSSQLLIPQRNTPPAPPLLSIPHHRHNLINIHEYILNFL
jgi:hypothetical protein